MNDLRRAERVKSLLKAKIVFNNRMTSIDCVIKNISQSGAKIAVNNVVSIPTEFELEIPMKGKSYRAMMRWRDVANMGVEFVEAVDACAPGNSKFEQLQAENNRLKQAIASLSKKLEDLGQDVPRFF